MNTQTLKKSPAVVPAKAGTHYFSKKKLDPRLRGGDSIQSSDKNA